MASTTPRKQWLMIVAVVVIGLAVAGLILSGSPGKSGEEGHGHDENHEDVSAHADPEHHGEASAEAHEEADEHADKEHHEAVEPTKGEHGGKLFTEGDYALEVTIFEEGVEPQFRLYTYLDGKLLNPADSTVQVTLSRLGQPAQIINFSKENDYLRGDAVVVEPHSFQVSVSAKHSGKSYSFGYEQVEARVSMTDAQLEQGGVTIGTAGPAKIAFTLQVLGEVRYNGDRTVQVTPQLAGRVDSVAVSAGETVRKGQVLAKISSQALAELRGELLAAQQRSALARTTYSREKQLWEEKISAEQDFLQAQVAMQEAAIAVQRVQQQIASLGGAPAKGQNLTEFEIRAPIAGVITSKSISVGEVLKEDSAVFTVSDLSTVWVDSTVAAKDLGVIAEGQNVVVSSSAFAATAEGSISYVSALVGAQTRSATARIVLANPDRLWRPGLPVTVEVVAEENEVPVAVAVEAIQTVRDWQVVFGRFDNELEARPLELGKSDGRFVEVISGLQVGDRYVLKNSFLIKAELGKAGASHDH
ncbi:efflux RND transporter periplasmic adaptor subunit [Pseudomonas sp.]|uniref:efflux RND transporter periplasmic adaptor subunit n=1 Tax=Pseudomonas sp. TaxID=306 RepID=UPI003C7245DC